MFWLVIPTRNEAPIIEESIRTLLDFLRAHLHETWRVVVSDNASTDATRAIVRTICEREPHLELLELDRPGKGLAVLSAWRYALNQSHVARRQSDIGNRQSDVFCFMDADLATDLRAIPELLAALHRGADIAVGSRFAPGARVERGVTRHLISWMNRLVLRLRFGLRIADAPCGCKAVSERVVRELVPAIHDDQWFFDTELLIRAQRAGLPIAEVPVTWREPRGPRGSIRKVLHIIHANLAAMRRL